MTAEDDQRERPAPSRGLSRRTLMTAGIGLAAVAAVGIPAASALLARPAGKLVAPLLEAPLFSVAHRGGSLDWPEMSLEAYRKSAAAGADALEVSLARSSDGVWFGLHDATLDRTSGTDGFVASAHRWSEIRTYKISARGTRDPAQAAQPYLRFEELTAAYAKTHTIFVDPKAVSPEYFGELIKIMSGAVQKPTESFIAKFYCTGTLWGTAAREAGYKTWGFYYGSQVQSGATPLKASQERWDLLGMDYGAPAEVWREARSFGKPVLAHIIPNKAAAKTAESKGAAGLIISGIADVLR